MATHYTKDGKSAYEILEKYPECPIKVPTAARCMTSARIDFEGVQDSIILWYEENITKEKSLAKTKTKILTTDEIQNLYTKVNSDGDWKIDVNSHHLVDKIIELWFESQGYDFWDNPFPEVIEYTVKKNNEIEFSYILI